MPFAANNGVRLCWDEQGSGTPILPVMGHRYSARMWYPAIPALAALHRVIWFDNRGVGESGTTRKVTVPQMAADAFAVMDAAGVERAHVYGVSMGGVIVQEMALQKPRRVRSLIVGCSGPLTADKPRMLKAMALLHYLPPGVLKLLMPRRAGAHGSAAPPEAVAREEAMAAADRFTVKGVIAQSHAMADYRTTREALAGLAMPALVIHGDEDAIVPIAWGRDLADILPDSRFVTIAGAGHNYIIVDPAKANGAVLDFVREVEGGGG